MDPLDSSLRLLRIIHGAMLASVVLYAGVAESARSSEHPPAVLLPALAAMGAGLAAGAFILRRMWVESAEERLRLAPDDTAALNRWRAGHITTFALAEAIALYGLVLRVLGAPFLHAAGFYAIAVLLLLMFTPRRP